MSRMPKELQDVILSGLQNLMALRLRGSPAADTIEATAKAWILALTAKPIVWETDRDIGRMKKAFVKMMGDCETWPAPLAFYERMPPREQLPAITEKTSNTMSPATRALVDKVLEKTRRYRRMNA